VKNVQLTAVERTAPFYGRARCGFGWLENHS
jgi:hypothetical protein